MTEYPPVPNGNIASAGGGAKGGYQRYRGGLILTYVLRNSGCALKKSEKFDPAQVLRRMPVGLRAPVLGSSCCPWPRLRPSGPRPPLLWRRFLVMLDMRP